MGCLRLVDRWRYKWSSKLRVVHGKKAVTSNDWVKRVCSSYLFGMLMPGRHDEINGNPYTYGFGGHERDDEVSGSGNVVDMGDRWLDVRLGRTPKTDRKAHLYPSLSPYSYADNNPIRLTDANGQVITIPDGQGGTIVYTPGMKVEGYSEVTQKYINELNSISGGQTGARMEVLSSSEVEYNVQISTSEEMGIDKGGQTTYNFDKNRVEIKVVDDGNANSAILGDEFTHSEQFEEGQLGFIKVGDNVYSIGYDFGDEIESKRGAVDALSQKGLKAADIDSEGQYESTGVMKLIEDGKDSDENIGKWLKGTESYKSFFGKKANVNERVTAEEGLKGAGSVDRAAYRKDGETITK